MMVTLSLTIEISYRVFKIGDDISILTTCINWSACGAFIALSIFVRSALWTSWFVSPILSCVVYYYFAFIDYEVNGSDNLVMSNSVSSSASDASGTYNESA